MILNMEQIAAQDEDGSRFTSWCITMVSLFNPALDSETFILRDSSKKKSSIQDTERSKPSHFTAAAESCPFSGSKSRVGSAHAPLIRLSTEVKASGSDSARYPFPSALANLNLPFNSYNFTPQQLLELFPYHITVDRNFIVIQEGVKLSTYLRGITMLRTHIGNIFQLKFPKCGWDWPDIKLKSDIAFELRLVNTPFVTDMLTSCAKGSLFGGGKSRASTADEFKSKAPSTTKSSADVR